MNEINENGLPSPKAKVLYYEESLTKGENALVRKIFFNDGS